NVGGTGDRRSLVGVTSSFGNYSTTTPANLVNGSTANDVANSWALDTSTDWSGNWIQFDFGPDAEGLVVIDEAIFYKSNNNTYGDVQWQGSDDGSTWDNLGSTQSFTGQVNTFTTLNGN